MNTETALPAAEVPAEASGQQIAEQLDTTQEAKAEGEGEPEKKELTPEQIEARRRDRNMNRLIRQRAELRARVESMESQLRERQIAGHNEDTEGDRQTLSLTPAQVEELVSKRAREIAPQLNAQQAEAQSRQRVTDTLAKEFGDRFDDVADALNDAFDGLKGQDGQPKPAMAAIFESDMPKALIEYLADPDNADEAEALGRMGAVKAGRAVGLLESKLKAAGKNTPKPSSAARPVEPVRGQGKVGAPDQSKMDDAQWLAHQRAQRTKH